MLAQHALEGRVALPAVQMQLVAPETGIRNRHIALFALAAGPPLSAGCAVLDQLTAHVALPQHQRIGGLTDAAGTEIGACQAVAPDHWTVGTGLSSQKVVVLALIADHVATVKPGASAAVDGDWAAGYALIGGGL